MINISFQVGGFPAPYRFFSHFLDLWAIFMERKSALVKTFIRFLTHLSAMFVSENQQDRGVLKYGFQLYMGISGYPVLNRAEML